VPGLQRTAVDATPKSTCKQSVYRNGSRSGEKRRGAAGRFEHEGPFGESTRPTAPPRGWSPKDRRARDAHRVQQLWIGRISPKRNSVGGVGCTPVDSSRGRVRLLVTERGRAEPTALAAQPTKQPMKGRLRIEKPETASANRGPGVLQGRRARRRRDDSGHVYEVATRESARGTPRPRAT